MRDAAGRFCPTCGAHLAEVPAEAPGAYRGHEDVAAAQSEAMRAAGRGPKLIALAVLLIGGLALLGSWAGWFPDRTQDAAGSDVELPTAGDLDDGQGEPADDPHDPETAEDPDAAVDDDAEPESRCRPDGCERWSVPAGPGPVLVDDGRIFHLDAGELLQFDAENGDVTSFGPSDVPVGEATEMLFVERAEGDRLLVHAGARVEAWDLAEGQRAWISDGHGSGGAHGGVVRVDEDVVVVVEVDGPEDPDRKVAAYDTATGEQRWSHDGVVLGAAGPIVVEEPTDGTLESGEVVLIDAASGEVRVTIERDQYRGGTDEHVALVQDERVEWRSWPALDGGTDLGPADETPPIVNGHLVSGAGDGGMSAPAGIAVDQVNEVVDPSDGGLVASYDEPVAVGQRPGGAGVVAQRDGSTVTVTAVDANWQELWRSQVVWEPTGEQPLWVMPTPGAVTVAGGGAESSNERWRFDWRTGLPVREGAFGELILDDEATGTFGDLTVRATAEQVTLTGPDGEVTFGASAGILHASDPLLVRDDGHLIVVEESLVSSP